MKAGETTLLKFLNATRQFVIPVYQRTYSWKRHQCLQLWEDILRIGSDAKNQGHFIGSVVYIQKGLYQTSAVPELLVIDGQQRLTTLSLLISALAKVIEEKDLDIGISSKKLQNYYLFNSEEEGDLYHKLLLTQGDKETLKRLVKDLPLPEKPSPRVYDNYRFFYEKMISENYDLEKIYAGLQKLIVVDISLDRTHDNPQLIFESLNSTGLDLSQADLIRNYVLMGLELKEQNRLYEDYWRPMELRFGHDSLYLFDSFMRDYLTLKTGEIPKVNQVYDEFKKFVKQQMSGTVEELLKEIHTYAGYYVSFALLKEEDTELLEVFKDIKTLRVEVSFPLILETYVDYKTGLLLKEEFIQILRLIESYVFRRAICGIPTNSLNKTFQTFTRGIDKSDYLDSVKAAFITKTTYRRFPTDNELVQELEVRDVYNFRSKAYLLNKLENRNRKERVNIGEYTIEHIMPQNKNLSEDWKRSLGENWEVIHEKFLHTLGNLTLTGYNSELSDRSFIEKRDMQGGFKESPIRLNQGLATKEVWNGEEIAKRTEKLAKEVAETWMFPNLSDEKLTRLTQKEEPKEEQEYTLEDHTYLQGESLFLFEGLREQILDIDLSVREVVRKLYIAYKSSTNFVDIIPYKTELLLVLNLNFDQIDDPKGLCRDITGLGKWGNGNVEFRLSQMDQLEYAMYLIRQSFEKHVD